ncbi:MAG: TolC family protein [Candidatus Cybelea sp.]
MEFLIAAVQLVTLAQAIAIAAARSPALQIAGDTYRLTRANVDLSKTPYQPNVVGTLTAIHGSSNPAAQAPSENLAGIGVTQLVYDGGHVLAQIRAAQASAAAGAGTLARSAQQLAFTVGQTYYNALEARAAVQLALRIVAQDRAQEDLIRAQIDAGVASHVDLATAQIPTAQALVQVARAQGQEIAALAAFDNAMGMHANGGIEPIEDASGEAGRSLIPDEPADYDAALARARSQRPDYQSAQHAVVAAGDALRAARTLSAPQVSLVANAGVATFPGSQLGTPANNFVGASMTLPVYDQGVKNAQTESAAIQVDLESATLLQTELGVELDVRQAFGILGGAREAVTQADAELKTAQEVLTDTQVQYRAGITNLALLLNAQSGLTLAETDRLNAVFALRQAEQSYLYALGDVGLPTAY